MLVNRIIPRTYIRGNNKRGYASYNEDDLSRAVEAVNSGMSLRCAAEQFNINPSTLHYKLKQPLGARKPGRPPVLSEMEEVVIRDTIKQVTDWGYGFCQKTVALLIKSYLDQQGRVEPRFTNNLPGNDFVTSFMKRNMMVDGKPGNIKRARVR